MLRIAAAQPLETQESSVGTNLQHGAVGLAAAAPFAGLIGQKKILHDPLQGAVGAEYKDMKQLSRAALEGDVLLTGKPKGSLFKAVITPAGGSQFYHAQPVTGRLDGVGYTASAGDMSGGDFTPRNALDYDTPIDKYMQAPEAGYTDAVLLRPKTKLTKEQLKALRNAHSQRVVREYDNSKAVGTFLRDTFVPKSDFIAGLRPETVCEGNVCSTMPAMAYHEATGKRVIPGKPSQDVFPTDFLRSDAYELVGSHVTPETRALEKSLSRKVMPWALRGGMGAALAGGTYAATENPALLAGAAGAYGANKLIDGAFTSEKFHNAIPDRLSKMLSANAYEHFPTPWEMADTLASGGAKTVEGKQILKNFALKRAPLIAAGGALAYGGAKALGAGYRTLRDKISE